jgi:hypothetical protein
MNCNKGNDAIARDPVWLSCYGEDDKKAESVYCLPEFFLRYLH